MRIIAGKHRGRVLKEFKGRDIRPTADRAKEAIFNILQTEISGSEFLDLFSGTGNIGIEALSRGADKVTFVDSSKESVSLIRQNLGMIKETAEVVFTEAESFVRSCGRKYDIIFLDPPYADNAKDLIAEIAARRLIKDDGVIIYEHSGDSAGDIDGLEIKDVRKYGVATFDFYVYGD